ncbi:MAG: hypothetical protein SFU99_01660, partial [Saprospiraceae bacterium]|nr:hypothetical protein [Saprospiraceae bacterium]
MPTLNSQVSLTTPTYSQDFNTFAGTQISLPTGWTVVFSGTSTFNGTGTGTSNTGGVWAYGSAAEFALGALRSGTPGNITLTASFVNNTGSTITDIAIAYDFEQWRFANTSGFTVSQTGLGASDVSGLSQNGTNPGTNGTVSVTPKNIMLNGVNIANGAAFSLSFLTTDISGADNGIAIDNFSLGLTLAGPPIIADRLTFYNVPASVNQGQTFNIQVCATDAMSAIQTDYATAITLMQNLGLNNATIMPMPTLNPVGGCVTYMITPGAGDDIIRFAASSGMPVLTGSSTQITVVGPCDDLYISNDCSEPVVDFTGFTGAGFSPLPSAGQLCSNNWEVTGFSDGDLNFGGTANTGDLARGTTDGTGETTGGIYALEYGMGNTALWIQPSSADFTSGSITLKVCNNSGAPIQNIGVGFDFLFLNDQNQGSSFDLGYSLMYSMNGADYNPLIENGTSGPMDALGLQIAPQGACINGANLADGECIYLRWDSDDTDGSGSRDEFGLDNIRVCPAPALVTDIVATCTPNDEKNKYNIAVSEVSGGTGAPYMITVKEEDGTIIETVAAYNGTDDLILDNNGASYDHSGVGGAIKIVEVKDANGIPVCVEVVEVVCGYPQNSAFCNCADDGVDCTGPDDVNCRRYAGAIMSQAEPGTFMTGGTSGQTQKYILVQNGNILQVNMTGLFMNLPNGDYSVYAINYCSDEEDQIDDFLEIGDPIQPLVDNVVVDGDMGLAGLCYTVCGPADYTVGCGIIAEDVTWTIPDCQEAVEVFYSFNLIGCTEDDLDLDLLDIDFGDLEDNLILPDGKSAQEIPPNRFELAGEGVLFVEYKLSITPDDTGIYPVTIHFNGADVTVKIAILTREPTTDYEDLSCTGQVNVRLDGDCKATLRASQLLNGALVCDDDFEVHVVYIEGNRSYINEDGHISSDPFFYHQNGGTYEKYIDKACIQYIYRVYYEGDLVCWGYVNAEDKSAPIFEYCPSDKFYGQRS